MSIPATCELWVDGARYADGRPGDDRAEPNALTGLTIRWGRDSSVDQPDAATCTFTVRDPPGGSANFDATLALGMGVVVWSELTGRRTAVFAGRITDMRATWAAGAARCDVVAVDLTGDLGNRFVGAEPWTLEGLKARAARILTAVAVSTAGLVVAPRLDPIPMTRRDVDRQAAGPLLAELATSVGGVLWCTYSDAGVPVLYFEDPTTRASLYVFDQGDVTLLWAPAAGVGAGTPLSARTVLRDPVRWFRAVSDLITRATVRWQDQTTSPGTTERSVQLVDTASEAVNGARGISIATQLTTQAAADQLAQLTLASHANTPSWRTEGLTWDLSTGGDPDLAWSLLGGTTRVGYAVALVDLPDWAPAAAQTQLYIEGGTYRYTGDGWVLALVGSPASGLGSSTSYWATDASVRYADVDPEVSYLDMLGVGGRGTNGQSWADQAAGKTWASVPAGAKWTSLP